ncbi:MAG: TonB family protein [Planctomycetes bacterium]|nr:TonB family protein [Planctomycetota bacterium]
MRRTRTKSLGGIVAHALTTVGGAVGLTGTCFLVLPLIQAMSERQKADMILRDADVTQLPPPPPPPVEEPEEEPEPEPPKPQLEEDIPLDLSQLELVLNAGMSGGGFGDLVAGFGALVGQGSAQSALPSLDDLDQRPRAVYQPSPVPSADVRAKAPGTVHVVFVVDEEGRVRDPAVQKSTDPVFERPALAAVRRWKFEPGRRRGEPVAFRMRVPITFPRQ